MAKESTTTQFLKEKIADVHSYVADVDQQHQVTKKDVSEMKALYAGMAEAVKSLAEDIRDLKRGLELLANSIEASTATQTKNSQETNNRLLWGFLGVIAIGVIASLFAYFRGIN